MRSPGDPMIYRTRPDFVEAYLLTPATADALAVWTGGQVVEEIDPTDSTKRYVGINIPTVAGVIRASENMFIVKHQDGHFGVMSSRDFAGKYELL
jgi:hypothetical protein